jgi:hypothetical protein
MMLETTYGRVPCGWSESLWLNKPSFAESLTALQALAERRLALLPPTVRVRRIRVTNPHLPRASMIEQTEKFGHYETDQAKFPGVNLLLRFAYQGYHTNYHLDGLPKGLFRGTAVGEAPDLWRRAFEEYCTVVKANCVLVNRKHTADRSSTETVVNPIESITPLRVSVRKRGMPFFMTRGRRR